MDSGLKQRLIGAAVLVALAVIFLPMLVQGPAPNSGVSDVPLTMPDAPQGEYETRDLPLVTPGSTPNGGAVGMDTATDRSALPTVDTAVPPPSASQPVPLGDAAVPAPNALPANPAPTPAMPAASKPEPMLPAAAAGGDYAVHFGSYATAANAESIVRQLRAAPLPGYSEPSMLNGKQVYRVRIGPYATRADAEAARLRASRVRDDVPARVVALDAEIPSTAAPAASQATASQTTAKPAASAITTQPLPAEPSKPSTAKPDVAKIDTAKPAAPASTPMPKPTAAAGVGFAVQLGAFTKAADATALRDRVRAAGFNAFTETVNTDKGALTRVRAGPVVGRADAEQLRQQVKAKTGIDGIVRPHP